MTRRLLRGGVMFATALSLSASAFAQNWILPAKTPDTPVACPSTICRNGSAWLAPYQQPVASFIGRFLDSSRVGDNNRWPIATVRAMSVKSLPGSDRIYLHMNASVAMYKKASFIDRLSSGETLGLATSFPSAGGTRGPDGVERILWPDAAFAAPFARSSWVIPNFDFTPQLGAIDVDDRRFVYLAYWQYGFGIIKDEEGGFVPVSQTFPDVTSAFVIAMKTPGGRYYALLSDTMNNSVLYDVTEPGVPVLQRVQGVAGVSDGAKNLAQDRIALVDRGGAVKIFTTEALATGGAPLNTFTPPQGSTFRLVVSDGTNFYGLNRVPSNGTSATAITVFTPSGGGYAASSRFDLAIRSRGAVAPFEPTSANYSDGYLTISGGWGYRDLHVFRVAADTAPTEVEVFDYLRNAYADPPPTLAGFEQPFTTAATAVSAGNNQLTSGSMIRLAGKEYLVVNAKGLGDVYEMSTSGSLTSTTLTSSLNPSKRGQKVTLTATVTSADAGTIMGDVTFRAGTSVLGRVALTGGIAELSTINLPDGTHRISAAFATNAGYSASSSTTLDQVVSPPISAPSGVTAIAASPTRVSVSWSPVSGATSYEVFRASAAGTSFTLLTTTTSATISDEVSANATYLYRVRSIGDDVSDWSAVDAATTIDFSDANLTSTPIKATHIDQLRTAVNAMRAAAGLSAMLFTDPSLQGGMRVKAVHILELRAAVDAARARIGLTPVNYTDPALTVGSTSRSAHVTELRAATQ